MKKYISFFILTLLFFGTYSFADINSTREVLRLHSQDNPNVLETYNKISTSWSEYENQLNGQWDLEKLLLAVEYAAQKHEGQVRKNAEKTPYIIHPIGVAKLLWEVGNVRSINVLSSALLHDTLEDTNATEEEVEALFGARVLYTVKEVTNSPDLSSRENKERQVEHGPTMSLDGQLVKLADRLYNVRDLNPPPPSWSEEKIDEYYGWGEKLLGVLRGTNERLELALHKLIVCHKNKSAHRTQVLSKQNIIDGYHKGIETGATHLLIVWDTIIFEDSYNYIIYCYPGKNINDLIKENIAPGYSRVSAVYAMHLDIQEQLKESRPWHTEYPNNTL